MVKERKLAESEEEKNRGVRKKGEVDATRCLAFSQTFPICLKTGWLNENTDPWVASP